MTPVPSPFSLAKSPQVKQNFCWVNCTLIFFTITQYLLYTVLFLSFKSVPSFLVLLLNLFLLSAELCWRYRGFRGGGTQWQRWHLFEGLAYRQPLSITPATRVTLLDLSPTNLSADALCGRKTSGHSLFGIRTAKVPTGDFFKKWGVEESPLVGATMLGKWERFLERAPNFQLKHSKNRGWNVGRRGDRGTARGKKWIRVETEQGEEIERATEEPKRKA